MMEQTKKLLINYIKENHIKSGYLFNINGNKMNEDFKRYCKSNKFIRQTNITTYI